MFSKYYCIADVCIEVKSPFPFYVHNAADFECNPCMPDYVFKFEETNNLPMLLEETVQVADMVWAHEYRKEDGTYLRAFLWKEYYCAVSYVGAKEGVCYYASAGILAEKAQEGFELLMYLCIEQILLKFGCLVLHSSHIKIDEKGLVFSAPCQTGKSTQAELWRQYAGAKILNGDRSVLKKKNDKWYVYGCPMCGTSNIHLQGKEELTNIIMLSKAKENTAKRIKGMAAFRLIYPQITIPVWEKKLVNKIMELLGELLLDVPIWQYACTKDKEAVTELKKILEL